MFWFLYVLVCFIGIATVFFSVKNDAKTKCLKDEDKSLYYGVFLFSFIPYLNFIVVSWILVSQLFEFVFAKAQKES